MGDQYHRSQGIRETAIKTAKDFIEWNLPILRSNRYLQLSPQSRVSTLRYMITSVLPIHPDFTALPKEEQAKVIKFLEEKELSEKAISK